VKFLEYLPPLEAVAEALRSYSRGSQRVLEVYSLLALNLVREPAPLPSYPRGAITVSSWLVARANILLECLLVTIVVTLGRR
jgi:hypothetical protein